MTAYEVQIERFQGPLDLLLQLIEREEMDITQISLAQVTEQYMGYLEKIEELNPEETADFLVVAAKLLYIKSKALLPTLELGGDEEVDDLEKQLKIYKAFLDASKKVNEMIMKKRFMFMREKPALAVERSFAPPKIDTGRMKELFVEILERLEPVVRMPQAQIERTVSIREKIGHIKDLILKKAKLDFHEILKNSSSKMEVIVSFLALLELVKQREIALKQDNLFENIEISKAN